MVSIAVDAMGGDDAPRAIVEGAAQASLRSDAEIVLVGDAAVVTPLLREFDHARERVQVAHASQAVPMGAKPRDALDAMPDASLLVAAKMVAAPGGPDALVSAGNSGAVILAAARCFNCIPGVRRTAMAAVIPTEARRGERNDPFSLLLDAGATLRVGPHDLATFGMMGSVYANIVSQNPRPTVALLSNGREPTKGTEEIVAAHEIFRVMPNIEFIGNIEGIDISKGGADVIVCDGFTGNITLKMIEGMADSVRNLARYAYRRRLSWKFAMWLLSSGIKQLKELTDWQQYGGAPILGFDRLCIKAHGRSGPRAVSNAIRVAERCVRQGLADRIRDGMTALPELRPTSDAQLAHSALQGRGLES